VAPLGLHFTLLPLLWAWINVGRWVGLGLALVGLLPPLVSFMPPESAFFPMFYLFPMPVSTFTSIIPVQVEIDQKHMYMCVLMCIFLLFVGSIILSIMTANNSLATLSTRETMVVDLMVSKTTKNYRAERVVLALDWRV
jgi:hypothetical membrane protein